MDEQQEVKAPENLTTTDQTSHWPIALVVVGCLLIASVMGIVGLRIIARSFWGTKAVAPQAQTVPAQPVAANTPVQVSATVQPKGTETPCHFQRVGPDNWIIDNSPCIINGHLDGKDPVSIPIAFRTLVNRTVEASKK